LLTVDGGLQLGEVIQHFGHFVSTLTASDVNNTVRVGVLGEGLGNASLTAAESSGNGTSTTLNSGEEGIEDTLASGQRMVSGELLCDGSGVTHGPEMGHVHVDFAFVGVEDSDGLRDVVLTGGHDFDDATTDFRRSHNTVLREQIILEDGTEDISTNDELANLEVLGGEFPKLILVEGGNVDTTGDEHRLGKGGDGLEGSLDTIENSLQDT